MTDNDNDTSDLSKTLGSFGSLSERKREALWEHYRRCDQMWRGFTPTIWSIPSVGAAINVGAYALLLGEGNSLGSGAATAALGVVTLLNLTVAIGLWKHRYLQRAFGSRLIAIEEYVGIPIIEFSDLHKRISGSMVYLVVAVVLFLASLALFFVSLGSMGSGSGLIVTALCR